MPRKEKKRDGETKFADSMESQIETESATFNDQVMKTMKTKKETVTKNGMTDPGHQISDLSEINEEEEG